MTPAGSSSRPGRRGAQLVRVLLSLEQDRRNRPRPWVLLMLLPLLASPALLLWALAPAERAARILAVVLPALLFVGIAMFWALVVFDVMRQNRPELARLVPGHVAGLRRSLESGAACLCAAVAIGAADFGFPPQPALASMAFVLGGVAVAIRWPWSSPAMPLLLWGVPSLPAAVIAPMEAIWDAYPWLVAAASVALMALALRAVVLTGSAYHRRFQAFLDVIGASAGNRSVAGDGNAPGVFVWGWQQRMFQAPYLQRMKRLLGASRRSVADRVALGLGAQADPSSLLVRLLCVYLALAVLAAIEALLPKSALVEVLVAGAVAGVVFTVAALPLLVAVVMMRTRREQALLRLLPGAPQGAALNGWLGRRFAILLAVAVAANIVGIAGLATIATPPAGMEILFEVMLCVMALSPLLVLVLWRDWSRLGDGLGPWQLLMFASTMAFAGIGYAWVELAGGRWWSLLGVTALILLAVGPTRWRHSLRAPAAWPAGRAG